MNLIWTEYGHEAHASFALYVLLGEKNDNYVVLDASKIPVDVAALIKSQIDILRVMPLDEMIDAIKGLWPGYGQAYKTISKNKLKIERSYPL